MALKADGNGGFLEISEKSEESTEDKKTEETVKGGEEKPQAVDKGMQVQMLAATAEHFLAIAKDLNGGADLPEGFVDHVGSMVEGITKAVGEPAKRVTELAETVKALDGFIAELRSVDKTEEKTEEKVDTEKSETKSEAEILKAENAELKEKLEKMEAPRGSNAQPVDNSTPTTKSADDENSWPMDMGATNKLNTAG